MLQIIHQIDGQNSLSPVTHVSCGFGHACALVEWHNTLRFCGNCGSQTAPIDAGRRKQCTNESCRKRMLDLRLIK